MAWNFKGIFGGAKKLVSKGFKAAGDVGKTIVGAFKAVYGKDGKGGAAEIILQPPIIVKTEESIAREKEESLLPQLAGFGIDANTLLLLGIPLVLYLMLRKK